MNTKGKRLAAILGLSGVVLTTGIGVYAATNDEQMDHLFDRGRPQIVGQLGLGERNDLLPEDVNFEMDFNRGKVRNQDNEGEDNPMEGGKGSRFSFAFIDENSLTEEQKSEIQQLQDERDEAIKKINDEFFSKLEKYISEDKLENYENFIENHDKRDENKKPMFSERGENERDAEKMNQRMDKIQS